MRIKVLLTVAAALTAVLMASPAAAQQGGAKPVCANCHEESHNSIASTHHGAKNDAQGGMCQACHGDATAHLKDPANKPVNKMKKGTPAAEKDAVCMTCHAGNRHLAFWESGKHATNEVSCTSCHNIHKEYVLVTG